MDKDKGVFMTARELYEDPLTGARNRRYFEEQLKSLDKMGAIAMIDVDNFKQINDSYGHVAGDAALCTIVRTIFEHVRADDVVSQWQMCRNTKKSGFP